MSQVGRKGIALSFILLTLKWSQIKDQKKTEKQSNKISLALAFATSVNAQLSNNNYLKALLRASFLSLVHNAKDKLSDLKLVAGLESESEYKFDEETNLFSQILPQKLIRIRGNRKKTIK